MTDPAGNTLARRLGTADAVLIGLGSMVGAGVFAVWAPAARAAGGEALSEQSIQIGLLGGLLIAAIVAYCNATASAQLAAVYPVAGGSYVYGRERLGPWWGFAAGWSFLIGKTASCAAMALTFATYAVPGPLWQRKAVALAAVLALAAVNYRGITRTALLTRILVGCTMLILLYTVLVVLFGDYDTSGAAIGELELYVSFDTADTGGRETSPYHVLQAAGLLFFAFAGYARIATLGEEVRDPARTIPRAILLALFATLALYAIVGFSLLVGFDPIRLAESTAPLVEAVEGRGEEAVVRVGAALASLGALLALIAGIGRTSLAMARGGDLPSWLAAVHARYRVPHRAEIAVAAVVGVLVLTVDLRDVIGFSSFGVLLYYAVANASAYTQPPEQRRWPRALNLLGLAGCLVLAVTLPPWSVLAGVLVLTIGLLARRVGLLRGRE